MYYIMLNDHQLFSTVFINYNTISIIETEINKTALLETHFRKFVTSTFYNQIRIKFNYFNLKCFS